MDLGRFISREPIEFDQRYAYAGGNPVLYVDPAGLRETPHAPASVRERLVFSEADSGERSSIKVDCGRVMCIKAFEPKRPDSYDRFKSAVGSTAKSAASEVWDFGTSRTPQCYGAVGICAASGAAILGAAFMPPSVPWVVPAAFTAKQVAADQIEDCGERI